MAGSIAIIFGILGLIVAVIQAAMAIGYGFSKNTPKSQRVIMFSIAGMAGFLAALIVGLMFMAHSKRKSGGIGSEIEKSFAKLTDV